LVRLPLMICFSSLDLIVWSWEPIIINLMIQEEYKHTVRERDKQTEVRRKASKVGELELILY
jgi:hypothetical protein